MNENDLYELFAFQSTMDYGYDASEFDQIELTDDELNYLGYDRAIAERQLSDGPLY